MQELASCQPARPRMGGDDRYDPYKVYQADEVKGSYPTRAEARRAQQRFAEAEPQQNFTSGTIWVCVS